jgi:hypothetical protein
MGYDELKKIIAPLVQVGNDADRTDLVDRTKELLVGEMSGYAIGDVLHSLASLMSNADRGVFTSQVKPLLSKEIAGDWIALIVRTAAKIQAAVRAEVLSRANRDMDFNREELPALQIIDLIEATHRRISENGRNRNLSLITSPE